jgi:AraC-like DNA-binding protein
VINDRSLYLHSPPGPPSLPRVGRLVWEEVVDATYRHQVGRRSQVHPAVQITLSGCGAIFDQHGAIRERCGVDHALIFLTQRDDLLYGYPPDAVEPWEFVYANLEGTVAELVISDLIATYGHVVRLPRDHALVAELLALVPERTLTHRKIAAAENARLAFDILAVLVEANAAEQGREAQLLDQAMTFLRAHLDRNVGVADAARHCGVTREHVSRCFARLLGEGPAAWLRRQRFAHAERLLLAGDLPIAEVAKACGFTSPSHFAHSFRKHTGHAPRRFRSGG